MENLLSVQHQLIEAMQKLFTNFKKDGAERKTSPHIKRRLDTLDQYWREFQDNHIKLCEYENQDYSYFSEKLYERTSAFYSESRRVISQCLPAEQEAKSILRPATPLAGGSMDWLPPATPGVSEQHLPSAGNQNQPLPTPSKVERGNQSKLGEMYRKQKSNFKALERAISNVDLELLTERWEFEDALHSLQGRWNAVDNLHWEIDSELITEDARYEETYYMYEEKYTNIKKSINSKMWAVSHREKITPKMEIPIFSGSYQQWTSFKDLFYEIIHKNASISKAQKMQFLKSKIKGEAEKLIQHLNISSDNYDTCWDILNHRYNNKRLIFNSHISTLLSIPTISLQSSSTLKKLHDTTKECLNAVKNLGVDISNWDPLVVHLLVQKLDADTHNDYFEYLKDPRELPTISDFLSFLEMRFTALESSRRKQETPRNIIQQHQDYKKAYNFKANPGASTRAFINHSNSHLQYKTSCPLCNKQHGIFHCKAFLNQSAEMKRKTVLKLKICENCLFDHKGKACFSEKRCNQCNAEHNTLLHEAYVANNNASAPNTTGKISQQKNVTHVSQECVAEILLATAQIKVLSSDGSYITMRALIDQGSQTSLISENAAQRLGLPRERCKGVVFGIGTKENRCKGVVNITASSLHSDYTFSAEAIIMNNLVNNLPNQSFAKPSWKYLEGIQLADPDFNISRPIDILLGAHVYSNIILSGIIREDQNQPIIQQSRLGWIICGGLKSYQCNVVLNEVDDISRFWVIEDVPESTHSISSEDQYCLDLYQKTTKRQEDGRYVVRLPLKPDFEKKLGDSKQKAVAQLHQLEKKFVKNEEISTLYKQFMREYFELGHMETCDRTSNMTPSCYLPHHCVRRAESTTTALRVVFNASSKTASGYSLNDNMYSGPNLQADLLSLIIKWRQYKIAFSADIEKMFRAILCHDDDKVYQKIVWRETPQQAIQEYALSTVTYGTKAAPYLAMNTLKQLARDERHKFPEAAEILEHDFYMDDLLSGHHSITSAKKIQAELINLLKSGGFNLRKWCSNSDELIKSVNQDENQKAFDFKQKESTKTLGLSWSPQKDVFSFQLKIDTSSTTSTKRSLLSDISKIFDPAGWLCPVTTKLKLLFQAVWQHEMQWDTQLPRNIAEEWSKTKPDLKNINEIQVQRWIQCQANDNIELHGFCDASERAYACVIYSKIKIKGQDANSDDKITLIAAKSKLVPASKSVTLPKLELCAAQLLSKLMSTVRRSLSHQKLEIFGWSDSTAVLGWIQGDITRWKPFVANRVQEIKDVIPSDSWRYVKSAENPADCASRGIYAADLRDHPLWWQGPAWLKTYQKENTVKTYTTNQEVKKTPQSYVTTQRHDDIIGELLLKHSSMTRVTRILTWVRRAVSRCKPMTPYLAASEIKQTKMIIIKYVQHLHFEDDVLTLKKLETVKRDSKLLSLNPFLDEKDLLRVGGRINHANIAMDMKHPLIIPHDGHFTNMLIDQAHISTFHGGPRLTLSRLRQQYWIVGGNRAVKKRIRGCVICRKHKPNKQIQIMGDLPSARCNPTRPFYHTGVDYTGHIDVKSNKGRGIKTTKGYIAVFVCMVTKAVHLELVSDLSSSAFLAALRRLAARRGTPQHMYSDNGTNFVGGSKHLKQEYDHLQHHLDQELLSAISDMEIEWHFNAPSWPSAGGLWEAAVKSLKFHLRRVIGTQKLTYEELSTLLSQLEACLNSRPLCALNEDPDDINCLTPAHFLSCGPTLTIVETERDDRTRWQLVQKIFADVWKRWQAEYLCQITTRSKWQRKQDNVEKDDIVVIHDANLPPGKWAMGRIIELHPGKDNYVRVVSIKTKSGIIKRPITKISILLPNSSNEVSNPVNKTLQQDTSQQTTEVRPKQVESKRSCNIGTFAMTLLLLFIISPAQCAYNLISLNNSQSIYLDKLSNMHLIQDQWKLIVYYDMDPYWDGINLFNKYLKNLETMCSRRSKTKQCDIVTMQLRHEATELDYYNNVLLGQRLTRSRRRRGLINGVGYLAHSLFGILDDEFAQKYEKDINLVRLNQQNLAKLWKNQTSVVEAQYNLLSRVEQSLNKQHKIFNQHLMELETVSNTMAKEIHQVQDNNEFTLSSIITYNILSNLKNIQETLLETITNIQHGKFNIHLLTPEQLRDELSVISGQLSKQLALPIDNIQTNLPSIYHLLRVKAKMTNEYFIFEIQVPLVSRDNFEIYKILGVPQQLRENMIQVTPISDYIAINIQKDSFIPLSESEVHRCMLYDSETHLCPLQKPIYHMKSDQSLCIKKDNQCEYNTIPCENKWVELSKVNTYLYFCCGQCSIRVICEHQVSGQKLSKAGIITLEDGCIVKEESFTIMTHKQQVSRLNIRPHIEEIEIPPINDVINITIPIEHFDQANESEHEEYKRRLLQIGQQIEQMKKKEVDISSSAQMTVHDLHQYVVVYCLLGAVILASAIYLWRRTRLRCSRRLESPPQPERQPGLNVHFANETTRGSSTGTLSQPTARVLDKSTSPETRTRFSECE